MQLKAFFFLSLALNLVLGGYLVSNGRGSSPPVASEGGDSLAPPASSSDARAHPPQTTTAVRSTPLDWRAVESDDYRQYIANLRGIGCPEETIRDIIVADVNKLFETRRKALPDGTNQFQFWKTGRGVAEVLNEARLTQHQDLVREKRDLLKALLGPDFEPKPEAVLPVFNRLETALEFLPAEKQAELMNLEARYAAKMMAARKGGGRSNPEEIRRLQEEKQAEIAHLLSPQEKEEYDLRVSPTANNMRNQLSGFNPTEEEFRQIFKLRKAFDDQWNGPGAVSSPEGREQRAVAQRELEQQIRGVLGDERYGDYQHGQEWSKSTLQQIAAEHSIPKQTAYKVFDVKTAAQDQVRQVRQDQTLTVEQRQAALNTIRDETERAVTELLGPAAAQDYISKGNWIRSLTAEPSAGKARTVVRPAPSP